MEEKPVFPGLLKRTQKGREQEKLPLMIWSRQPRFIISSVTSNW